MTMIICYNSVRMKHADNGYIIEYEVMYKPEGANYYENTRYEHKTEVFSGPSASKEAMTRFDEMKPPINEAKDKDD